MVEKIKQFFEKWAFGVCAFWGKVLHINPSKIRIYFIYVTFASIGSFILPYLIMAFLLQVRSFAKLKQTHVWDL